MSSKVNSPIIPFESELNSIVREYLNFANFTGTVTTFDGECSEKGRPVTGLGRSEGGTKINKRALALQNQLLHLFDSGQRKEFFKVWKQNIAHHLVDDDPLARKLEFLIQLHFVVFPLRKASMSEKDTADAEEGMTQFKNYLETRGTELSHMPEFIPYFAMPYVQNPRAHPSFQTLFSDTWVSELHRRVEQFLLMTLESSAKPRLFELYKSGPSTADYQMEIQRLQQQVVAAEKRSLHYTKCANRLQADYHSLITLTAELVDTLEATIQGHQITPEYLQEICTRLFSNHQQFANSSGARGAPSAAELMARPGTAGQLLRQSIIAQPTEQDVLRFIRRVDFPKVKNALASGQPRERALLLQALRWQLTHAPAGPHRDTVLQALIAHDCLGCADPSSDFHTSIVSMLNAESDHITRQYAARLFNTLASICKGRSYLAQSPALIAALQSALKADVIDPVGKEHVLATMQKLSLRQDMQLVMIENDMITWLLDTLDDSDSLSDYSLEFAIALLMNLCLRSAGRRKCAANPQAVVKVLSDLLGHDNQSIKPYVNGALYSILSHPVIREHARAVNLDEVLKGYMTDETSDLTRQLRFIVKQMQKTDDKADKESDMEDEDEEENDQDSLEVELDRDEVLRPNSGEPQGERLLLSQYALKSPTSSAGHGHSAVGSHSKTSKNAANSGNMPAIKQDAVPPLQRPSTPAHAGSSRQPSATNSRGRQTFKPGQDDSVVLSARPKSNGSRTSGSERPPKSAGHDNSVADPSPRQTFSRQQSANGERPSTRGDSTKSSGDSSGNQQQQQQQPTGEVNEYQKAFASRPKVPRTPDANAISPTSMQPPPMPKFSGNEPKQRPGSGNASRSHYGAGAGKQTQI